MTHGRKFRTCRTFIGQRSSKLEVSLLGGEPFFIAFLIDQLAIDWMAKSLEASGARIKGNRSAKAAPDPVYGLSIGSFGGLMPSLSSLLMPKPMQWRSASELSPIIRCNRKGSLTHARNRHVSRICLEGFGVCAMLYRRDTARVDLELLDQT